MILKTLGSIESSTQIKKGGVEVGDHSKAKCDGSEVVGYKIDNSEVEDDKIWKKDQKTSKSKNLFKSQNLFKSKKTELDFFTFRARMVFTKLRQMFVRAVIFHHFDLEYHIRVEMDVSGYAISEILS